MRNKPRVEFSEKFINFAESVINQFNTANNPKLAIRRHKLNVMAQDFGIDISVNAGKQGLRDFLRERGYKIHIGASAVHVSKIPVTNVPKDQWPSLVENLGRRLLALYVEKGEQVMRIWPAQFRNIATVWPADHVEFNQMVIDHMQKHGYTLTFHVNSVDMRPVGTEGKRGKKPAVVAPERPMVEVMNGRSFLPIALAGRRVSWRRGYTQALMVNAKPRLAPGSIALNTAFVLLRSPVYDKNGAEHMALVVQNGDVVLVNDAAHDLIKDSQVRCAVVGTYHEPDILAVSLKD